MQAMPPRTRPSDNICLDARAVQHRVSYSLQNISRLEAAGVFPKRIHLGPARVGWPLRDVLGWMQAKVDARRPGPMSPKVIVEPDDRFIGKKELRTLVLYTVEHIRNLELAGEFPGRIRIGDNRVAWLEREVREWVETQRNRGAASETYHVRLCRPRFEVATLTVKAADPKSAEEMALASAKTGISSWRMLPDDPQIYQPHAETCVMEEAPTYSQESVEDILTKYQDKYVRYLMLYADTNKGEGTVLLQPWFTDERLAKLAVDLARRLGVGPQTSLSAPFTAGGGQFPKPSSVGLRCRHVGGRAVEGRHMPRRNR